MSHHLKKFILVWRQLSGLTQTSKFCLRYDYGTRLANKKSFSPSSALAHLTGIFCTFFQLSNNSHTNHKPQAASHRQTDRIAADSYFVRPASLSFAFNSKEYITNIKHDTKINLLIEQVVEKNRHQFAHKPHQEF